MVLAIVLPPTFRAPYDAVLVIVGGAVVVGADRADSRRTWWPQSRPHV